MPTVGVSALAEEVFSVAASKGEGEATPSWSHEIERSYVPGRFSSLCCAAIGFIEQQSDCIFR
jgi:hypothetical protein